MHFYDEWNAAVVPSPSLPPVLIYLGPPRERDES